MVQLLLGDRDREFSCTTNEFSRFIINASMCNGDTSSLSVRSPPSVDLSRVRNNDIVCDSNDSRVLLHPANRFLTALISKVLRDIAVTIPLETLLHESSRRIVLSRRLVSTIRHNIGGRFLARTTRGTLSDIGDRLATSWTSKLLKKSIVKILDVQNSEGP